MRRIFGLVVVMGMLAWGQAAQAALIVDFTDSAGNQWADLTGTTNLTWNQIAAICPQDGTACAGNLNGMAWDGWIWASQDQVRDLFVSATDLTSAEMSDYSHEETDSSWAPQFLTLFADTGISVPAVNGWTSTFFSSNAAMTAFVRDATAGGQDVTIAGSPFVVTQANPTVGAWLYRTTTTVVPEPSLVAMFAIGFGVATLRRRRS